VCGVASEIDRASRGSAARRAGYSDRAAGGADAGGALVLAAAWRVLHRGRAFRAVQRIARTLAGTPVIKEFGEARAKVLGPQAKQILDEVYWWWRNSPPQIDPPAGRLHAEMRRRHPELSEPALQALRWAFSALGGK